MAPAFGCGCRPSTTNRRPAGASLKNSRGSRCSLVANDGFPLLPSRPRLSRPIGQSLTLRAKPERRGARRPRHVWPARDPPDCRDSRDRDLLDVIERASHRGSFGGRPGWRMAGAAHPARDHRGDLDCVDALGLSLASGLNFLEAGIAGRDADSINVILRKRSNCGFRIAFRIALLSGFRLDLLSIAVCRGLLRRRQRAPAMPTRQELAAHGRWTSALAG